MRSIKSGMSTHFGRWLRRAALLCIALGLASCGGGDSQGTGTNQAKMMAKSAVIVPSVTVTGITKVSETRVSRTVYDYVFQVTVKNNGSVPQSGVTATLTGAGTGTTIIDGTVQVGNLAAGASVTPQDTITLRQDRTITFNPAALIWQLFNNSSAIVTGKPTSLNPVIQLTGYAILDFSAATQLLDSSVTISQLTDTELNNIASNATGTLHVSFTDATSLLIVSGTALGLEDKVEVTVPAGTLYSSLPANQAPMLYFKSLPANTDGDIDLLPIDTTVDESNGNVTARIPSNAFQTTDGKTYSAVLKLGIATTYPSPAPGVDPFYYKSYLQLICPFGAGSNCIESSQANGMRQLANDYPRVHDGIDLIAPVGTNIYPQSAGNVILGESPAKHNVELKTISEAKTGGGCGIFLVVSVANHPGYSLKYCHLSNISGALIDPNYPGSNSSTGLLIGQAITDLTQPIAVSGKTGSESKDNNGSHLHLTLYGPYNPYASWSIQSCFKHLNGIKSCRNVAQQIEPFHYLINSFAASPSSVTMGVGSTANIQISAHDASGGSITSAVQDAIESVPGNPTRKICLTSSSNSITVNPSGANVFAGPNQASCVPWPSGTSITIFNSAALPAGGATETVQFSTDPSGTLIYDPLSYNSIVTVNAVNAPDVSDVTFYPETTNPLLLSIKPTGGKLTTFFGKKDELGNTLAIDGLYTQSSASNNPDSTMLFDAQGRLSKVMLTDGSQLTLVWQSATQFVASLVTADGKIQVDVPLDMNQTLPPGANTAQTSTAIIKKALPRSPVRRSSNLSSSELDVLVTTNGQPETGAQVSANIVPLNLGPDHPGYYVYPSEIAPGQYATSFVNFPSSIDPSGIVSACEGVVSATKLTCKLGLAVAPYMVSIGCIQIGATVSLAATPVAGAAVIAACEATFITAAPICTAIGNSIPGDANNFCSNINNIVNFFDADGVLIKAKASNNGLTGNASITVPSSITGTTSLSIELHTPFDGTYSDTHILDGWTHSETDTVSTDTSSGIISATGFHTFTKPNPPNPPLLGSFSWTATVTPSTDPATATLTGGSVTISNLGVRVVPMDSGSINVNSDGSADLYWLATDPVFGGIGWNTHRPPPAQ